MKATEFSPGTGLQIFLKRSSFLLRSKGYCSFNSPRAMLRRACAASSVVLE
jgi:hypothetical protein